MLPLALSNDTLNVRVKNQGNFINVNDIKLGYDFINVADNVGNVNTIPINVKPDYFTYGFVSESSLSISGDTSLNIFDSNLNYSTTIFWDQFTEDLFITILQSTSSNFPFPITVSSIRLVNRNLNKENTNEPKFILFRIELSDTTSQPVKRVEFIADSTKSINIIEASGTKIRLDFNNVTLTNNDNTFNGTARLNGRLVLESEL